MMKSAVRKTVKTVTTSAPKAARSSKKSAVVAAGAASSPPASDLIARRSYELYLARGGEHGHDVEDWLQAERELGAAQS